MVKKTEEKVADMKNCCYEDLKGNAYTILKLLLADQKADHIASFFDNMSDDEYRQRHFVNIDWKSIAMIANGCVSRQETLNYLNRLG